METACRAALAAYERQGMSVTKLYTFREAAELLAIPESTLRKKAAAKVIPSRKVFRHTRFNDQDLLAIQEVQTCLRPATGRRRARPSERPG
jgi:excisionase family DNA binding protein